MAGKLPGSSLNGATIPRQQLLVAYPHFTSVTITDVPVGSQRYDSLQMKATRRFSGGLGMQISYTLSKQLEKVSLLNAQDAVLGDLLKTSTEKRLVEFDSPHAFVVLTTWELPVGRGERLGSNLPGLLRGVVGNWNLNLQYTMRSGLPFAFPNGAPLEARSAKFTHAQRDALARQKGRSQFDPVFDVFFDTSLFPNRAQAPYTLRDFPTRFPDVRSKALNIPSTTPRPGTLRPRKMRSNNGAWPPAWVMRKASRMPFSKILVSLTLVPRIRRVPLLPT